MGNEPKTYMITQEQLNALLENTERMGRQVEALGQSFKMFYDALKLAWQTLEEAGSDIDPNVKNTIIHVLRFYEHYLQLDSASIESTVTKR
jgi:hypothetical protein